MRNLLTALLLSFLWLFSGLSLADDPGKTEVTITDDGWVEVPLDFTFPFYNQNYVTSFMFSNGVIGFMNPNSIPGTGISNDGLCCNSYDFSTTSYDAMGNYGGVRFDYVIMPWHTDLIDIGTGKFYIQGNTTFQSYFWENISEYYDNTNLNTFDTTIYPTGNIKFSYQALDIQSHSVSVALIGDLSAGQYTQWFYNNPSTDGGVYWTSGNTVPVEISGGQSICDVDSTASYVCTFFAVGYAEEVYSNGCSASALYDPGCAGYTTAYTTQQCGISSLYDPACTGYETAYLDNQCVLDSTYSPYCSGYSVAIAEEENEYDYEEAYEDDFTYEEELVEDIYIPEVEYEDFFDFQPEIVDTNDYTPEFQTYEMFTPEVEITTYETTIAEVFNEIETQMMEEFDDFSMDMFEDFPMPEMDMSEPLEEIMMMDDFPPMMEDFSTEMQVDDFTNTMEDFPEMLEMPEIEQEVELTEQEELTEEIMPEPELEQEPEPGDQEMLIEEPVEEETIEEEVIEEIEEVEEVEETIEEESEVEPEEEIEEEIEEEEVIEEEEESDESIDEDADEENEESNDTESNDEEESEEVLEPEAEEEVEEVVVESKIKEPTAAEKKKAKQAKLREIITSKLKSLAVEMGEAASLAEQQELQNFIIALLNFNLGFNSYNSSMIDGTFYDNRDIYLNMKVPENQRGLRNGLANQILHNKLVDIQYEEDYGRSRIQGD